MTTQQTNKKTVLLVGGDDIALRGSLAAILDAKGWSVSLLGSARPDSMPEGVDRFFEYDLKRDFGIAADIKAIRQVRSLLKQHDFDLVHVFDTKPGIFVPLAAIGTGHRIVRTITGLGRIFVEDTVANKILRGVYATCHRLLNRMVHTTIFYNNSDLAYFVDHGLIPASRGTVIPGSGIDVSKFDKQNFHAGFRTEMRRELKLAEDRLSCVCVAKLERRKGVPEYIEAARICAERELPVDFVLVGPLVRETETLNYQTLADARGVHYIGERDDVEKILAATDIMILPTRYPEGIPRSLTEAASMGLALIASDQPGCRAVIDHGENGFLVDPGTAQQLADHVQQLVEEPGFLKSAREQSLAKAPQFSLSAVVEKLATTYDRAVTD